MPKLQMPSSCGDERTHAEYRLLFYKGDLLIYSNNGRTSKKLQQAKEARQKEKYKV